QLAGCAIIDPAACAVARFKGGPAHGGAGAQQFLEAFGPERGRVLRPRAAHLALEDPLQVVRTYARVPRELGQRDWFRHPRLQVCPRPHHCAFRRRFYGVRLAAAAGTEARGRRVARRGVEGDVLALRPARGAARAAIDAGGPDGKDEAAVVGRVPLLDGGPVGFVEGVVDRAHAERSRYSVGASVVAAETAGIGAAGRYADSGILASVLECTRSPSP